MNATGVSTFNSKFIRMMIIDAQGLSNTTIKNTSFSPHMLRIFDIIHWRHNNNVDIMINIYYYSKETIRVSDEKGKKRKEKEKKKKRNIRKIFSRRVTWEHDSISLRVHSSIVKILQFHRANSLSISQICGNSWLIAVNKISSRDPVLLLTAARND